MSARGTSPAAAGGGAAPARDDGSRVTTADYVLGLRAWGLILYGALPANLALLGVLEVKLVKVTDLKLLALLLPLSVVPLFLVFLLIRGRHREWYLTTDFLNLRSALHVLVILLLATLVFGLSAVVFKGYKLAPLALLACDLRQLEACWPLKGVVESFLFAVGSLVLSSTLFMTLITKGGDLPGLPTSEFTTQLGVIREKLRRIQAAPAWKVEGGDCLRDVADEAGKLLADLHAVSGNRLAKESLRPVEEDLQHFIAAAEYIDGPAERRHGPAVRRQNWVRYFAPARSLTKRQSEDREFYRDAYAAVWRLRGLKLGG